MTRVLERGDIYFVYRPRVDEQQPTGLTDVQRLYMILSPHGKDVYRRLVIGRKRLPEIVEHERNWVFVDKVARWPEDVEDELDASRYVTKTRGEREQQPGRPAGEGVYAIVDHNGHTHLAYALELPQHPGEVQRELGIEPEASYIASVRNPDAAAPPGAGLPPEQRASFPKQLQERFQGRRFTPLEPDFLEYERAELVLIGAREEPEAELGIRLDREHENAQTAEIFTDLKMERDKHPLRPLFEGIWE